MRKAVIFSALMACSFISCQRESYGTITHRGRNGQADQWMYQIDKDDYKILVDTNGDGRPDVIETYKNGKLIRVESDRNFDGQVDLVQEFSHGVPVRELHDDDFDGKIETIRGFRNGKVVIVERDPQERGYIDIVEYYDESGKLIGRDIRHK